MDLEPFSLDTLQASAYTIPTDSPEADGTFAWDDTTLVLVQARGGGKIGIGWTYGPKVIVELIRDVLAPLVCGVSLVSVPAAWELQVRRLRNIGRPGIASMAVSAIDCALWDLAARCAGVPLHELLGAKHTRIPLYGSGGFTSYDSAQLDRQLHDWLDQGFTAVKIKIGESWGTNTDRDLERIRQTCSIIGHGVKLFVDANGGYTTEQVRHLAPFLDDLGVAWWEEPVSSDDHEGLRIARDVFTGEIAAGEYGYSLAYFRHLCDADALDCVQADVTRCGGITELLRIADLADEYELDISGHCAPHLHAAALAAVPNLRHLEWFHDHARIERMFFDGGPQLVDGELVLDASLPGQGLSWRRDVAEPYRVA